MPNIIRFSKISRYSACIVPIILLWTFNYASGDTKSSDKFVICFVRTWAIYRSSFSFRVENIDPSLCTHLVYMFAGLSDTADEIISKIPHIDLIDDAGTGHGMFTKMVRLKDKHPHLKVLLSIGGESQKFSTLSASSKKRLSFSKNAVSFLRRYGFDGVDLYWTYPANDEDKQNFPLLLQEVKKDFTYNNMSLSVTISGLKKHLDNVYDVKAISENADWVNINVYNYHTANDAKFGIHAPMDSNDRNNIKYSVESSLNKGVASNKIVLRFGVHGYGYSQVDNAGNFGGPVNGLFSQEDTGFLTIYEICEYLDSGWSTVWNDLSSTPVAIKENKKISYDDPKSLKIKARYAVEKRTLGVGFSSLDTDDFKGVCTFPGSGNNDHKYPLLKAVRSVLFENLTSNSQLMDGSIEVSVVTHEF